MKRVAIYIRKAAKADEEIVRKETELLKSYACAQGGTVIDTYLDNGYSGMRKCRPELDRLLKACNRGNIDDVLILRESELTRNREHLLKLCDTLQKYGVELTFMESGKVDYSVNNMLLSMSKKFKGYV